MKPHAIRHGDGEFFIEHEGRRIAEITYQLEGRRAVATHTWVEPRFRGGSLARDLVDALAHWARQAGNQVMPVCPYVARVFAADERYADLDARRGSDS